MSPGVRTIRQLAVLVMHGVGAEVIVHMSQKSRLCAQKWARPIEGCVGRTTARAAARHIEEYRATVVTGLTSPCSATGKDTEQTSPFAGEAEAKESRVWGS